MPAYQIVSSSSHRVGEAAVLEAASPSAPFAVVFEDDGVTGYFYGLDPSRGEQPIVDALHIYNVAAVTDRDRPSTLEVAWSASGMQAALFINSYPHAVLDFAGRRGYCRSGFPARPHTGWSEASHEWHDEALDFFR